MTGLNTCRVRHARIPALAMVIGLAAGAASCSKAESPTEPSRPGAIELTVSPTTVSYAGGAEVGGAICPFPYTSRWGPFVWTIRETNNRPVTITSFKWVVTTIDGREESNEEVIRGLAAEFAGAPGPTVTVAAGATLTSRPRYDCELEVDGRPAFPGGTAVFTATGTDDGGTAVSSTARLTLLPPS